MELGDLLAPYSPVEIKCNVGEDVARLVEEHGVDWPGVAVEINPIRDYPDRLADRQRHWLPGSYPGCSWKRNTAARGFVPNRDKVGYAGVELSLQEILTGTNGKRVVQVDVAGKELRNLEPPIAAVPGLQRHADDRHPPAGGRRGLAAAGDRFLESLVLRRHRAAAHLQRRGDRHESPDRRDPGDGLVSRPTRTTAWRG